MASTNILITGATGFVGKRLCVQLVKRGRNVTAAVREHSTALPDAVKQVVVGSYDGQTEWAPALDRIDAVVHLAARTHVMRETATDPLAAYRAINVEATGRLARQAAAAGVRRFVYMSSVKVNGEGRTTPYTEDDPPAPEDAYGVTKSEAEQMLRRVERETDMQVVTIRPPLVYGPGVKANFLALIRGVDRRLPLPVGGIRNRRSLVFLDNLVDAVAVCVDRAEAAGQTYLVSDGEDVSTPELVRRIGLALGRRPIILPAPQRLMRLVGRLTGRSGAVDRLLGSLTVDIAKIRRQLDWSPPHSLDEGLSATARWFNER